MTAAPPSLFDVEPGREPGPTPPPDVRTRSGRAAIRDYVRNGPRPNTAAEDCTVEPDAPASEPVDVEHPVDARRYRCEGCGGLVAVPDRLRSVHLADVERVHAATCPGRTRGRNRQENDR